MANSTNPMPVPPSVSATSRPIALGIAGLGMAGAFMIRAAVAHPGIRIVAGADPLPRPREAFKRDLATRVYEDFDDLCRDADVEAIYIGSPHELHPNQAIAALHHGKHVVVEKPLALTLPDCDRVIDEATRSGLHCIVGHTHGFDVNVQAMRGLIRSGEVGPLGMILAVNYSDFLLRPRRPEELDTAKGGGITFNQVSHQIEIVRTLGGGMVRSVRANVGSLEQSRPTEGHCTALLEFENGAAATIVLSAYDFFDSDEFHFWIAEGGTEKPRDGHGNSRRLLRQGPVLEADRQRDVGYGGRVLPTAQPYLPHFGLVIATCARADLRLSPNGILIYGADGVRDELVTRGTGRPGQGDTLDALWRALRGGQRDFHDARWGKATLEVALAILQSARERREISLHHQVACP
jgi:phthalate 4,5-cis-dihydrodiol dehydrogenase